MPKVLYDCGCYHKKCATSVSPYFGTDTICYRGLYYPIKYANSRRYIDERTESDKKTYLNGIDELNKEFIKEKIAYENKKEYCMILYAIPESAPKSLSAYTRIKNKNTEKFKELSQMAQACGIYINEDNVISNEEKKN